MPRDLAKRDAQERADRIRVFRSMLGELTREGVLELSDDQRTRVDTHLDGILHDLAGRFDVDVSESQKQISWGMRIASAIGGFALCAAVVLLFYRFWGVIPIPGQVAILLITPLTGLAAIHVVSQRERTLYFTGLLALITVAAFVLNLWVLGSIFNIAPTPNAFAAWGAFALLLAYAYGLRVLLAAGLVSLMVYISATIVSWSGASWPSFNERPEPFLLTGTALALLPIGVAHARYREFPGVYRLVGLLAVFVAILYLWYNGESSYLPFSKHEIQALYQLIGFVIAGLAIWLGVRRGFNETVHLGCVVFTIFLFIKLADWWWDWMPAYLFFFLIGSVAVGLLVLFRKLRTFA